MSWSNDTEASTGTNTNDSEVSSRLQWLQAHRTWANSHFMWRGSGANFNNDDEATPSYPIGKAIIGSTFIIGATNFNYDDKP